MKNRSLIYIKNIIPCLLLSVLTGAVTGGVIFLFKYISGHIISLSDRLYGYVRENPIFLPLLIISAAVLGLLSALTLKLLGNCKGGGIPTAIALVRGLMEFKWLRNILAVFGSALITYLGGLPLGNEGPSVQMGTAVGRGAVRLFAKKHEAWDRYIMTGGACAGFAAATAAPITGIFFAFEEAHRRFSPMIFMSASSAAVSASGTIGLLDRLAENEQSLFGFSVFSALPLRFIYNAVIVGIICGLSAIIFTHSYKGIGKFAAEKCSSLSLFIKIPIVFVGVAAIGFGLSGVLGSGHSLIESLMHNEVAFYLILIYLGLRAVLLMIANNVGITGGLFLPTLAFGAMLGSLCGKLLIHLGLIQGEYYPIIVIVGIASFLAASSRTPIMAIVFSIEALGGALNVLPVALGVTVAYIIVESAGISSFTDSVIENKVHSYNKGLSPLLVDTSFTVKAGAFVEGKEIRDILWPPTCVVTSLRKAPDSDPHSPEISVGDILHLHYITHHPEITFQKLEDLLGEQSDEAGAESQKISENHQVPEI